MSRSVLSLAAGLFIVATVAHAHHSISGVYDSRRQVTIEGTITEFQFVNPHPFLLIDVVEAGGRAEWRLEMDNRSELARAGMTAETLKPGDRVIVAGSPARAQSQGLYIRRLDRPADGFWYEQVGSSPRIRRPR